MYLKERRHVVGGACITEELWPGFKSSRASYVCGLFRPQVTRDLGLNLRLIPRRPSSFTPDASNQGGLLLGLDKKTDYEQIAKYSKRDADRFVEFERVVGKLSGLVDPILDVDAGDLKDTNTRLAIAKALFGWTRSGKNDALAMVGLVLGSARNQLVSWFESEPLRSTLATDALIGTFAGPSSPGTGYVLVHHMMGNGPWSYVRGGMGTITQHLSGIAQKFGVRIETDVDVKEVNLKTKQVVFKKTTSGNGELTISFKKAIVSNLNPLSTLELIKENDVDSIQFQSYSKAVKNIDFSSPVMKMNLALDSLPIINGQDKLSPFHMGTIHLGAQTLEELDESFHSAQRGELPSKPMIEMTIPSTLDDTLTPPGKHVCSLFVQHVPPKASESFWMQNKDKFADHCFRLIDQISPGFSSKVIHRECLAPPDLERVFGLRGGNIFHGAMTLDRLLFSRPVDSFSVGTDSSYTTFHKRLFLCSAGTHPGGGVMGACGRNAALAVLKRVATL